MKRKSYLETWRKKNRSRILRQRRERYREDPSKQMLYTKRWKYKQVLSQGKNEVPGERGVSYTSFQELVACVPRGELSGSS